MSAFDAKFVEHFAFENFLRKVQSLNCEAKLKFSGVLRNNKSSKADQIRHDGYELGVESLTALEHDLNTYVQQHHDDIMLNEYKRPTDDV